MSKYDDFYVQPPETEIELTRQISKLKTDLSQARIKNHELNLTIGRVQKENNDLRRQLSLLAAEIKPDCVAAEKPVSGEATKRGLFRAIELLKVQRSSK